jgi:hypothetical protein
VHHVSWHEFVSRSPAGARQGGIVGAVEQAKERSGAEHAERAGRVTAAAESGLGPRRVGAGPAGSSRHGTALRAACVLQCNTNLHIRSSRASHLHPRFVLIIVCVVMGALFPCDAFHMFRNIPASCKVP